MAARRNKQELPELSEKPGLVIPVNSLVGPSYQLLVPSDDNLEAAKDDGNTEDKGESKDKTSIGTPDEEAQGPDAQPGAISPPKTKVNDADAEPATAADLPQKKSEDSGHESKGAIAKPSTELPKA